MLNRTFTISNLSDHNWTIRKQKWLPTTSLWWNFVSDPDQSLPVEYVWFRRGSFSLYHRGSNDTLGPICNQTVYVYSMFSKFARYFLVFSVCIAFVMENFFFCPIPVHFTDCTDKKRFVFSTDDSRFVVETDGKLKVSGVQHTWLQNCSF